MSDNQQPMNIAGRLAKTFLSSKITAMIMLAITLVGLVAVMVTPREYNPQIVVPAANIIVAKPGATADEVENTIVKPLEAIMNAQAGVKHAKYGSHALRGNAAHGQTHQCGRCADHDIDTRFNQAK